MKKKNFEEGVDYTIHEYKRKKKRTGDKPICPICSECKNKRNCLNRKSKETYKKQELQDDKFISEHPEAQLAIRIFGKENNVGSAIIGLDVINSDEWQEKRKAQIKEFEEKGITIASEERE